MAKKSLRGSTTGAPCKKLFFSSIKARFAAAIAAKTLTLQITGFVHIEIKKKLPA